MVFTLRWIAKRGRDRDVMHYDELSGLLDHRAANVAAPGRVVFCNISHGAARSRSVGLAIKYVARGSVRHEIGGRVYRVQAGQFICVPDGLISVLEVRREAEPSMIGACLFLQDRSDFAADDALQVERPLIFPAACSTLGQLLGAEIPKFLNPGVRRGAHAAGLLAAVERHVEPLLEEVSKGLASLSAAKARTRYEGLRRLNVARGYLHDVTDRPVDLAELARIAGMSRFQLLRDFRSCFGAPPGAYHRRLRLQLAKTAIDTRHLNCGEAAQRFGFADNSSFTHAFKREFGVPPIRTLKRNAEA